MSASSNCVTCGRFTQAACSRGAEMRCTRLERLDLDAAEGREIDRRHAGSDAAPPCATPAAPPPASNALDVRLDVVVRDAALDPGAMDRAEVDPEFARESDAPKGRRGPSRSRAQ